MKYENCKNIEKLEQFSNLKGAFLKAYIWSSANLPIKKDTLCSVQNKSKSDPNLDCLDLKEETSG